MVYSALSGPSHAEEVLIDCPTTVALASKDEAEARSWQELLNGGNFRVYTSTDVIGLEVGGATKNIYAIAAGISKALQLGDNALAALASRACVGLYGLESLAASVQDQGNNYTRFVCIAKDLEIYPGADRTSLMMVLPHKPGSLYKVLSRFYALGINLNKLESRPLPERDFEFMFYFDLETSVYSPQFRQLMGELPGLCEEFSYLGSYQEVV